MSRLQQLKARELEGIYDRRFSAMLGYRNEVWRALIGGFFQRMIPPGGSVLDLGCGYGEFINNVRAGEKFAMDLNPSAIRHLKDGIRFFEQDCSETWPLPENALDAVFTSNFFEHLPDKATLRLTLNEACRCLKPGGILIALGPNIRLVSGAYWDFWDHYLCLTDRSLAEGMSNNGFTIVTQIPAFLPYTMSGRLQPPPWMARLYLRLPVVWPVFGRQFLVVGRKPEHSVIR